MSCPSPGIKSVGSGDPQRIYDCEVCKDQGGLLVRGDDGREYWRLCGCLERKKAQRLMRSSQMTDELRSLGFRNFATEGRPLCVKSAYECARDYLKRFEEIRATRRNSIALLGVPGTGKTHLLVAIANNLIAKGVSVLYFPHVEGFGDIKDNLDLMEEKLQVMKSVDVLLWDDLYKGRKEPTPFQLECIFNVINYRYLNNKPIMVSSEKDVDELVAIDEGIGSRIYEMCKDYTVIMQLTDLERVNGQELNYRLQGA
ncbi:ATP-binding protein [Collibacillus ludicampi]|nr:ATP-binding protein [Collibacillus ludicampi]